MKNAMVKQSIFYGKTDFRSAFRVLPLNKMSWAWLVMMAKDPISDQNFFFVDKCLPFGSSMSCSHFQRVSDAIRHIVESKARNHTSITNYLDDFLFVHYMKDHCNALVNSFLQICEDINFPIAMEKTEFATPHITFLGILLDGNAHACCLAVPEDKRVRTINIIQLMTAKWKTTVKEIQRLAGTLNFLVRAIHLGRPFVCRMYTKYSDVVSGCTQLKHYHHIKVDAEFKADCSIWEQFLIDQNSVCRPMVDLLGHELTSKQLFFYTDASKSMTAGSFGCVFSRHWTFTPWETGYIKDFDPSIAYLELFALCMGIFTWQQEI